MSATGIRSKFWLVHCPILTGLSVRVFSDWSKWLLSFYNHKPYDPNKTGLQHRKFFCVLETVWNQQSTSSSALKIGWNFFSVALCSRRELAFSPVRKERIQCFAPIDRKYIAPWSQMWPETEIDRSPLPEACNSHTASVKRRFHKLVYF